MSLWGGSNIQQYEKYLGLSPMVGRLKSQAFFETKKTKSMVEITHLKR